MPVAVFEFPECDLQFAIALHNCRLVKSQTALAIGTARRCVRPASQSRTDGLGACVAANVSHLGERDGIPLAGRDAGDVRDDKVQLHIYLRLRHLHVLDM